MHLEQGSLTKKGEKGAVATHSAGPPAGREDRLGQEDSSLPASLEEPKDWSFSFSISPSSEHPGLVSFGMDWLDLVAVQRTLKSLLQHHSSEASILCSAYWSQETPPLGLNKPELFLSPKPSQTSCALPVYRAPVGAD